MSHSHTVTTEKEPIKAEKHEHSHGFALLDEKFLMAVACIGAAVIGEWREAIAVALLYLIGEYLQDKAEDRSRRSIRSLMELRPDTAQVLREGELISVPAEDVSVGETISVPAGGRVPLDGTVIEGSSELDFSALTGESLPVSVEPGDQVYAGGVNGSGTLLLRTEHSLSESAAGRILKLVEEAEEQKAKSETFITRFSKIYTPTVVALALAAAVLPPLLQISPWKDSVYRALNFLVISCPCALVIGIPLTYFAGLGRASRAGILIKGSNYMDVLAQAEVAAFDKTGTLTTGRFSREKIITVGRYEEKEMLTLAAAAESGSTHPLAMAVLRACGDEPEIPSVTERKEYPGKGISCQVDGKLLLVGNDKLMKEYNFTAVDIQGNTAIHVAFDGEYLGALCFADTLKPEVSAAVRELRRLGVRKCMMLSGDRKSAAEKAGNAAGLDAVYAELSPEDKLNRLKEYKSENPSQAIMYVGDGINDAPVLSYADVGIAMGGLGSDAAMEAADVVIMADQLHSIPKSIEIARKTLHIARENIIFILLSKLTVMLLAVCGVMNLWISVFADVGVCLIAIANALRAAKE